MRNKSNQYISINTTNKRKTAPARAVIESNLVTSITNVAKPLLNGNHNHNLENAGAGVARSESTAPAFPSLSKGTLKSTSLTNSQSSPTHLVHTLTKVYPGKVKHIRFKKPFQISIVDTKELKKIVSEPLNEPEKPRTPEQIKNSLDRSLARTRREMNDIADCNDFDKFATFTIDPKKHNAYDIEYCKKKMIFWLNNQQKLHGSFNYLMVMELMKDGKVHFHALLGGFKGKYHATNIRGKGAQARQCYKIDAWEKNYGFADMEDIEDKNRLVNYIMKYISKDVDASIQGKNSKRYFASKNLNRPRKIYGHALADYEKSRLYDVDKAETWENDFVEITTIPKT